jgi:asparagine synthetase B (glutamine-hydrolysing)
MSAIAGIYQINGEPVSLEHSNSVMRILEQFPADDIQILLNGEIFLGCLAQWITPESIGEKLPYYDHNRKLAITADAIIDNRQELFEKLQIEKSKQPIMTDSELILLSYYKWGEESPKYLVGDFAFMIWDENHQKLFGARDPSGYRTLYYYKDQSRFAFCTTIEPLLSLPYIERKLNEDYLSEFLAITGMIDTVEARMTPFSKINQVQPFHSITLVKGELRTTKYGSFIPGKQLKLKSNDEYVEAFQEIFQEAVTSKLRTHKNIGSQLSGGLDSGAVVGFAARALRNKNKTLNTLSYIPPNDFKDFTPKRVMPDESPFIKKTVQHVGGISDYYFDFDGKNSYTEINTLLEAMEMPYKFLENSFWLKGMFEKGHEKGLGILLNGDKGNSTISWGSALDFYAILLKKLKWVRLFQELNQYSKNMGGPRLRLLPNIARIGFPFLDQLFQNKDPYGLPTLINPKFAERTDVFTKLKEYGIDRTGWVETSNLYEQRRIEFEDIYAWNSGSTLNTKLSLRYSLWKRDPTNDIRVVRFCLSVPEEQCVQNGLDRALIRRSTENILPDQIRLNQRIWGIQGADWVHRIVPYWKAITDEAKKLSNDERALEYMDRTVLNSAIEKLEQGPKPTLMSEPGYRNIMRSLIVYRFIKQFS